jgi:hypothetical protein
LRDGELLAARDLLEQIGERGLGCFKGDRLHNARTLTRLPAPSQFFSRGWTGDCGRGPPALLGLRLGRAAPWR